jgi:hypothetical protein
MAPVIPKKFGHQATRQDGGEENTTTSLVQQKVVLAACATTIAASPWSCSSTYMPRVASPLALGFFSEAAATTPGCLAQHLSPWYEDALAHVGFNPNTVFSLTYDEQQCQQGNGADDASFTGRRGLLQFETVGCPFDEMQAGGEEEAAHDDEEEYDEDKEEDGDEDDEEDGGEEDGVEDTGEAEENKT